MSSGYQSADPTALPEGVFYDPIVQKTTQAAPVAYGNGATTVAQVHGKEGGWLPAWKWVTPPGVGDAPQHVFTTFALFPLSVDGPGDRPASFFHSFCKPIVQNFAMRYQGMAVDGGSILMTGLYAPAPMASPAQQTFSLGFG